MLGKSVRVRVLHVVCTGLRECAAGWRQRRRRRRQGAPALSLGVRPPSPVESRSSQIVPVQFAQQLQYCGPGHGGVS